MFSLLQFRSLIDELADESGLIEGEADQLENIREHICECCIGRKSATFRLLKKIESGLIAEHIIEKKPLHPYHEIAATIRDCVRVHEDNSDKEYPEPQWAECIKSAKKILALQGHRYAHSDDLLPTFQSRAFAVAQAASRLVDKGYNCIIDGYKPSFSKEVRERISRNIEDKIETLGSLNVIDHLCHCLNRSRSDEMERYLFPSRIGPTTGLLQPDLPINFLLQLALKKFSFSNVSTEQIPTIWNELSELARDFSAVYDTEAHCIWELHFIDAHNFLDYLSDLAQYDFFFRVRQLRASNVPRLLSGLFSWVTPDQEAVLGFSIKEAATATEILLSNCRPSGPTVFQKEKIVLLMRDCGITAANAIRILKVFTHGQCPNAQFLLPEDHTALTFHSKPLIAGPDSTYLVCDKAICAPAFYEAVADALRPRVPEIQKLIGAATEQFLIDHFHSCGVATNAGKYDYPGGEGECDAVIETDDTILFLELKAKALTRTARAGSDVSILIDLLGSLLKAISQANGHEFVLRKNGKLDLQQQDGSIVTIEHRGRQVEKVAVTLLDFGRFQDRTTLTNVISVLLNSQLTANKAEDEKDIQKLNEMIITLGEQYRQLNDLDQDHKGNALFNHWFLSVPQMLVLIDGVLSNQDFKEQLWKIRHMSTLSLDWYTDMAFAQKLSRHSA